MKKRLREVQLENYKGVTDKISRSTKNSQFAASDDGKSTEPQYMSVAMPCITQPDRSEEIKLAKQLYMKTNLDAHMNAKKDIQEK